MRLATQPLREFSHNSRAKIRIEFFITHLVPSTVWQLASALNFSRLARRLLRFRRDPQSRSGRTTRRPFAVWPHLVLGSFLPQVWKFLVRSFLSRDPTAFLGGSHDRK